MGKQLQFGCRSVGDCALNYSRVIEVRQSNDTRSRPSLEDWTQYYRQARQHKTAYRHSSLLHRSLQILPTE